MAKPQITTRASLAIALLLLQAANSATSPVASAQVTATPVANAEERQRGIELYRQEKFAEAAKLLRKALKKNHSDDEAWYYLGLALLHQPKEVKEASKALETALKLRPNFAAAHAGLSYSLLLRNKPSEAIREAQAALSIEPGFVDAHYVIGVARLRTGHREEALQQAEAAIKLNPQFALGYLLKSQALASFLGDVLFQKEGESGDDGNTRFSQAAKALEEYLQLDPNAKDKQTWIEQLESLRFYAAPHRTDKGNEGAFTGREVTTKARVIAKPEPAYTANARQAQVTGTVVLRAVLASDGTVKHFLLIKGLPYGLTEASVRAARKIKFIPAAIDGRPVSMFIQIEYNFNLY